MLNFLRKLRRSNINAKYLSYAVGEIILVVVGIVIAFQLNEWKEERQARAEQRRIYANVHEEFLANKTMLDSLLIQYSKSLEANILINDLVGRPRSIVEQHNIDSLFYESLPAIEFFPSSQSIDNILQSGRLGIIEDEGVLALMHRWTILLEHLADREKTSDAWTNDFLIPMLVKYISFKDMDLYGNLRWAKPSRLKRDYYLLFTNPEFESILDNSIFLQEMNLQRMKEAKKLINEILEATKQYLSD